MARGGLGGWGNLSPSNEDYRDINFVDCAGIC